MKPFKRVSIVEMPLMEGNGKIWGQKLLDRLIGADMHILNQFKNACEDQKVGF